MTTREATRILTAAATVLTFLAHQLPADTPVWVSLMIGAANAGVLAWLGMREPGAKPPTPQGEQRRADV